MGGSGSAMAAAAAAGAKRGCVCVCKSCYAKMAAYIYTVRITGWVLKKKSQFYRALNYYLWSLQSLKHTSVGRESCEKIGETLLFSLPNFFESEIRRTQIF